MFVELEKKKKKTTTTSDGEQTRGSFRQNNATPDCQPIA